MVVHGISGNLKFLKSSASKFPRWGYLSWAREEPMGNLEECKRQVEAALTGVL
jgi:hypothetical protein